MNTSQPIQAKSERPLFSDTATATAVNSAFSSPRLSGAAVIGLGIIAGFCVLVLSDLSTKWLLGALAAFVFGVLVALTGRLRVFLLPLLIATAGLGIGAHLIYVPDHSGGANGITLDVNDVCLAIFYAQWMYADFYLRRTTPVFFQSISVPFLGFFVASVLSLWKSSHLTLSAYGLIDYLKDYAFFFFLANTVRQPDDVRLIFRGLQLILAFLGVLCIAEVMLQSNFNNSFEMLLPMEWEIQEGLPFRAGGLTTPTYTGGYLASMLPLMLAYFVLNRESGDRALSAAAFLLGVTALVLTLTRTAFVSMGFGSLLVMACLMRKRFIRARHVVVPLLTIAIVMIVYKGQILARLEEGSENLVARQGLNMVALNMILDNPFLGVGINTYHEEMDTYTPNSLPHEFRYVVHNKFLLLWAETGVIGLLSFLTVWVVALTQVRKLMRSMDYRTAILGIGLFGALAALGINMNLEAYAPGTLMYPFWLVVALAVALNGPLYQPAVSRSG